MTAVDYIEVLRGVCDLVGDTVDKLSTTDSDQRQRLISNRLGKAWRHYFWPDLMLTERRTFRADYNSGTAYTAATEVYFAQTKAYYQTLRSTTGNAPADSAGVTNFAYWYPSQATYGGDNYDATKSYVVGDMVYYPTTDTYYAAHTAGSGNLPTDTAHWGALTAFNRSFALDATGQTVIGEVREV